MFDNIMSIDLVYDRKMIRTRRLRYYHLRLVIRRASAGDDACGNRRTSAAQTRGRVADRGARFRHIRFMAHGDFFLPRFLVVGADRLGRMDRHLAIEPATRDHSRPSDPEPPPQRGDRLLAPVAGASLFDLPRDPSRASPRRKSDRSLRRSRELLLD